MKEDPDGLHAYRAASRTALAVDDDVTFCLQRSQNIVRHNLKVRRIITHNSLSKNTIHKLVTGESMRSMLLTGMANYANNNQCNFKAFAIWDTYLVFSRVFEELANIIAGDHTCLSPTTLVSSATMYASHICALIMSYSQERYRGRPLQWLDAICTYTM